MRTIQVDVGTKNYFIYSGTNSYDQQRKDMGTKRCYLIADQKAYGLHKDRLDFKPVGSSLIQGEKEKSLEKAQQILEDMAANQIHRSDCVIGFGGGVCGDMAAFCASIYMRGIDYYALPTTLLAQVDSSVGGKCGVNMKWGKNLIGSFHHPQGVYFHPEVLQTLPEQQIQCGMAELLKTALLFDEKWTTQLEKNDHFLPTEDMILKSVDYKRKVVEKDPKEKKERMLLNFGHTIGHAIEGYMGYEGITHGHAVAIGMAMITKMSEQKGHTKKGTYERLVSLLKQYGLDHQTQIPLSALIKYIRKDKKVLDQKLNLILLADIGYPKIIQTDFSFFEGAHHG